jgi:hypothetical protein
MPSSCEMPFNENTVRYEVNSLWNRMVASALSDGQRKPRCAGIRSFDSRNGKKKAGDLCSAKLRDTNNTGLCGACQKKRSDLFIDEENKAFAKKSYRKQCSGMIEVISAEEEYIIENCKKLLTAPLDGEGGNSLSKL